MTEVVKIGLPIDGRQQYEVTTHDTKKHLTTKTMYSVAVSDVDKFEKYHATTDEILNEIKNIQDTPQALQQRKRKLIIGATAGAIIGAGVPIGISTIFKSKLAKALCFVTALIGGISGVATGIGLVVTKKLLPKNIQQKLDANFAQYKQLDVKKLSTEELKDNNPNT